MVGSARTRSAVQFTHRSYASAEKPARTIARWWRGRLGTVHGKRNLTPALSSMVLCVCGNAVAQRDDTWCTHHSFGRIIERLCPHFKAVHYHAPRSQAQAQGACDYPLVSSNLTVHAGPSWRNSLAALKRPESTAPPTCDCSCRLLRA